MINFWQNNFIVTLFSWHVLETAVGTGATFVERLKKFFISGRYISGVRKKRRSTSSSLLRLNDESVFNYTPCTQNTRFEVLVQSLQSPLGSPRIHVNLQKCFILLTSFQIFFVLPFFQFFSCSIYGSIYNYIWIINEVKYEVLYGSYINSNMESYMDLYMEQI